MSRIVSVYSFRRGTGKTTITANITALLVAEGWRVGVIDTSLQVPRINVLFGVNEDEIVYSLNDYLWGKCSIYQTAYNITPRLGVVTNGRLFMVPAKSESAQVARILREGYDVDRLHEGYLTLLAELALDMLLIDTYPGLNEETLGTIALSDTLLILLRLDQQDYQGTGVTVEVASKLDVPRRLLIVNNVPPTFDIAKVKSQVEQSYHCEVAAVLPHSQEMMSLASAGIFALRYPNHPTTILYKQIAAKLVK